MRAVALATAFCTITLAVAAMSQSGSVVEVVGSSSCPAISSINELLHALPHTSTASASTYRIEVVDGDQSYFVIVNDFIKRYFDDKRDCVAREKIVAAYVAVVLTGMSTTEPIEAPSASAAPSPSTCAKPAESSPTLRPQGTWSVEMFDEIAFAPGAGTTWGGQVAARTLRLPFGGHLGCEYLAPFQLTLANNHVAVQSVPCFGGISYRLGWGDLRLATDFDLSFAGGWIQAQGVDFAVNNSASGFEWGGRFAITTRLEDILFTPLLQVEVQYFPRKEQIWVDHLTASTTTPNFWLLVNLGVAFQSGF